MSRRRVCGYDLNGWRDMAARNWMVRPGEDAEPGSDIFLTESGPLPVVVQAGDPARWIGGPQAMLAPHGRGEGWGEVGRRERRVGVRQALERDEPGTDLLAAALGGLAQDTQHAVLAIDDTPFTTEHLQERLLSVLGVMRISARLLVWRPVLAALFAIDRDLVGQGQKVGVICQTTEGLSLQTLRIRRESGAHAPVLAPERRTAGRTLTSDFGYRRLVESASQAVAADQPVSFIAGDAQAVGRLTLGLLARREILRLPGGAWHLFLPPKALDPPEFDLSDASFAPLADCDVVLLETLTEGRLREGLERGVAAVLRREVVTLPPSAIAQGALVAARRIEPDDPIYFDFLPQISTIVQRSEGAVSFDLIGAEETLQAGRLYRSERPARLAIPAQQDRLSVYLRKQAEDWPRKAIIELGTTLTKASPVDLWVEQAPAAGRATILMQSPDISRQLTVDWETAEQIHMDWDSLVQSLATPLPTIPKRLVLPCGMQGWAGTDRARGLAALLAENASRREVDWDSLAVRLVQRPYGFYCISSDGELPRELDAGTVALLTDLTARASAHLRGRVEGSVMADNASLKFLTWQFRRCPGEAARLLCDSLDLRWRTHLRFSGNERVLQYQGLGRVARDETLEAIILDHLRGKQITDWSWRRESACLAFLLSRSDTAPLLLTHKDVQRAARIVIREFEANIGAGYTKFAYAPFLLGGLLRWRLKEPRALVAGIDRDATAMARVVERAIKDINGMRPRPARLERYLRLLGDLHDELQGAGGNPDLLLDIYGASQDLRPSRTGAATIA